MDVSGLPPSLLQRIFPGDHTFTNQNKQSLVSRILRVSSAMMPQPVIDSANVTLSINTSTATLSQDTQISDETLALRKAAWAWFKDVECNHDAAGFFAKLLRILDELSDELSGRPLIRNAFSIRAKMISRKHTNLPGMPRNSVFDSIRSFVDFKNPKSCSAYIESQAACSLLRCIVALNMNEVQVDLEAKNRIPSTPYKQVIAVINLVETWTRDITLFKPDVIKKALISLYWRMRKKSLLASKLPENKANPKLFYNELMGRELKALFAIVRELLSGGPTIDCVNKLPAPLFTYYNMGEELPELDLTSPDCREIKAIFQDAQTNKRSHLLKSCLLYVLYKSDPDYLTETVQEDLLKVFPFPELLASLYALNTTVYLGKATFEPNDLIRVGQVLVDFYPNSPVMTMALLLLVVEHLEKSPTIEDPQEVRNILFLLSKIYRSIRKLPSLVQGRVNECLTQLFSHYDQTQTKENGTQWNRLKKRIKFDESLSSKKFKDAFKAFNAAVRL